jgi:hypothetical protein
MQPLFVDTYFENAFPLRHEHLSDGSLQIDLVPEHERFTGNRQSTHWNFKLHVPPEQIGRRLRIIMRGLENIWNGRPIPVFDDGRLNIAVSDDGRNWHTVPSQPADATGISYEVELSSACVQIARNVPYTLTDLNHRLAQAAAHPAVRIYRIGATVEGRPLEMVELGNPDAPRQVLFRGAAHPWESGGTWFLDGMMQFLTSADALAETVLRNTCFCLMPMSNKDGVCRGMTRFNVCGMDLNRNWSKDRPADPALAPENACLQNWLNERQRQGRLPRLAIDMHNDGGGRMHLGRHQADPQGYRQRMDRLEQLMKDLTWFREGIAAEGFGGSIADGMIEIWGIDSFVYELNAEWSQGLQRPPLHTDWQQLGASYVRVLDQYL